MNQEIIDKCEETKKIIKVLKMISIWNIIDLGPVIFYCKISNRGVIK